MQYYLNDKKLNKIEKQKAEKDGLKIFELGSRELLHSSKKIILLPSGFSRHPLGLLVLQPNEYLGSILY